MSMQQKEGENLRDFISRFNLEAVTIPHMQQKVAVLALMSGLRDGPFRQYLGRKNFKSLAEVFTKANEYIRAEEFSKVGSRAAQLGGGREEKAVKKEYKRELPFEKREYYTRGAENKEIAVAEKKPKTDKFSSYTELAVPREKIYAMHKLEDTWRRPKRMHAPNRDKRKWCEFHEDYIHTTDKCKNLKDDVEELVRRGYFIQYKKKEELTHRKPKGDERWKGKEK